MIHDTQNVQISQKQDGCNIHLIMKIMFPPSYYHNDFVATEALGYMMYGYTLLVPVTQRVPDKPRNERNICSHK